MSTPHESSLPVVWLNGYFRYLDEARISPLDRGFLYGDGVFETMRAEDGTVLFLDDHLKRLYHSLKELRIHVEHNEDWQELISELLDRNGLQRGSAAVKLLVSRGTAPDLGLPTTAAPTVMLHARRYHPPEAGPRCIGWRLHIAREGFAPPLARHKSLNYLYYLWARQQALDADADEAVIVDRDGYIAETAAGSVVGCREGRWWTPSSPNRLRGITLAAATRIFGARGIIIQEKRISEQDLLSADTVWILNSLMLVMPVIQIDGSSIPYPQHHESLQLIDNIIQSARKQPRPPPAP